MQDIAGPHHARPNGEIGLIMPIAGAACFHTRTAGWLLYPPGNAHRPTDGIGRAPVLDLWPDGQLNFTR